MIGITITHSAGTDGALLIFLDGEIPEGVRVIVNDEVTLGKPYAHDNLNWSVLRSQDRPAKAIRIYIDPADIAYEEGS